jgi:hypothetical protein
VSTQAASATVEQVVEYLEAIARLRTQIGRPVHPVITVEGLVKDLGQAWTAQALPPEYERLAPKNCFENTWETVRDDDDLRYVEGYALSEHGILPVPHAWAVDPDGCVIDTTWERPERAAFYGLVIPKNVVVAMMFATRYYGVLGNDYLAGHPFAKLGRMPTVAEIRQIHAASREHKRAKVH